MTSTGAKRDAGVATNGGAALVSIVILSFNRPELLEASIASALAQSYRNVEIFVIDNKSPQSDRITEIVQKEPRVTLVSNAENLGFTGGMNQGFALARGKYVHFTEDDIVMDPACIEHLVQHLEANEDVALASGFMLNPDDTVCCAGGTVSLDGVYRVRILRAEEPFDPAEQVPPYDVSFVPGAFICARRSVIERIGAFNEHFYLYFEDTELCARALKAGYRISVVPAARVYHARRAAAPSPDYVQFHRQKNFVATYVIHAPWSVLPEFLLRNIVLPGARTARSNPSQLKVQLAAYRWIVRNLPALLRERHRVQTLAETS